MIYNVTAGRGSLHDTSKLELIHYFMLTFLLEILTCKCIVEPGIGVALSPLSLYSHKMGGREAHQLSKLSTAYVG